MDNNQESRESSTSPNEESDDMFNYQCNLMDHGLLYMNFTDAIAEGDGGRIMLEVPPPTILCR